MRRLIALCALLFAALHGSFVLAAPAPPGPDVVAFYTRPLVKARLRLPDSLQNYTVQSITPTADDPARFAVQVQFKARTPFGAVTEHTATYLMKATASGKAWVVTAAPQ